MALPTSMHHQHHPGDSLPSRVCSLTLVNIYLFQFTVRAINGPTPSTHHEHHPDYGFPILFFCSLSPATDFLPRHR